MTIPRGRSTASASRAGSVLRVVPTISWLLVKGFCWRLKEKYIIRDFHPLVLFYAARLPAPSPASRSGLVETGLRIAGNAIPVPRSCSSPSSSSRDCSSLLFAMWFDMESNKDLRSGRQSARVELPAGARLVVVYEGSQEPALPAVTEKAS